MGTTGVGRRCGAVLAGFFLITVGVWGERTPKCRVI